MSTNKEEPVELEQGTYEIIRNRLNAHKEELRDGLSRLNASRKEVFGAVETKLISAERVTTQNNCIPRDMVPLGDNFIFGYNVHIGLRTTTKLNDVFSIYSFEDHRFHAQDYSLINDQRFINDFEELYKYYKTTQFSKFAVIGPFLYMVFQIGKAESDIKAFKWKVDDVKLTYIGNRSDHEVVFPDQHEFDWVRTTREMFRSGLHSHISIEDKLFVETIGGDLTIKIEDNTDDGKGIYSESVEYPDQNLGDAEIFYAIVENLIFLKVRPYKEEEYRYIIFNQKNQEAERIDAIENSCVLLPDDHGVIFPRGYYLQTGESKLFDLEFGDMLFQNKMASPNGEDFLYVFYNNTSGTYILLSYNLITQKVETPIICHGFSFFDNGELCYFKAEEEAQTHHVVQIWQTPYESTKHEFSTDSDSILLKIGNKDIVKGMAECHEVINLIAKEDTYANLYLDIVKKTTGIIDSYYWLSKEEAYNLQEPLDLIRSSASSAIDEYEKVVKIRKNTEGEQNRVTQLFDSIQLELKRAKFDHIDHFVQLLANIRSIRGQVTSLKELRYVDLKKIESQEEELAVLNEDLSNKCVQFLLKKEALNYYVEKISSFEKEVEIQKKVVDLNKLEGEVMKTSKELEMLIEIVSNLKIEDATQTTKIVSNISDVYAQFNQINAVLKRRRKELQLVEGEAVFSSQLVLINQSMINYLDISDTAEKCEEYLTKVVIQLEELEAKFSDFEEYLEKISDKRDEVYSAFESRKIQLTEQKNKRTSGLQNSANRILKGVASRLGDMESLDEINGYMASDLMVDKLRNTIEELIKLGDTVKADDLQSKLKSVKEDAIRQLRDKRELFEGDGIITFGEHKFSVNNQVLDLTIVPKGDGMYYHITGTNFFELIEDETFIQTKSVWSQEIISENGEVYRSEYLAWQAYRGIIDNGVGIYAASHWTNDEILSFVETIMAPKYDEGYTKGVHDKDAAIILRELIKMAHKGGVLKFSAEARACASFFWNCFLEKDKQIELNNQIKSAGSILKAFPNTRVFDDLILMLAEELKTFNSIEGIFNDANFEESALYLFQELASNDYFSISKDAFSLCESFSAYLKSEGLEKLFANSLASLTNPSDKFTITKSWIKAYAETNDLDLNGVLSESAMILSTTGMDRSRLINTALKVDLDGLNGVHANINNRHLKLDFHEFSKRLKYFSEVTVGAFKKFNSVKRECIESYKETLKLDSFKPRVMNSFVRNELINKVYLPLIGANLAKQIGSAGENKRTDLMGMLLLISPPGYGKTTLMEYIASRLGIIFLKVNGPSIGHSVTSLDPDDAPNAGAREEIEKLNLGFEMGDNVMIYLDDIQHCNPEFLQKFISLCDGQRKIEGVYKGKSRTYDLRGKKVCVVMAGNPYTESGDKFKIPDMLANRADIYNLGDIIGDSASSFELSYLENCLTSNTTLRKLSGKSQKDLYTLIQLAETGSKNGREFESNHTAEEVNDHVAVLKKLIQVRDIILKVNQQYILSAAMEDQYRIEPPFKLQGSYRNMNKIAEKVIPIMNDEELKTLVMSTYEGESQTLATSAESNLLKFKIMVGWSSEEENIRWENVKKTFQKNQKLRGFGDQNQMSMILAQMEVFTEGILGIKDALNED